MDVTITYLIHKMYTSFFLVIDPNVFQMAEKKLCQFGQKYRLMNIVTASFNNTVSQITEMSVFIKHSI